jgi:Ni,Fe-hydrogenase III large subunit
MLRKFVEQIVGASPISKAIQLSAVFKIAGEHDDDGRDNKEEILAIWADIENNKTILSLVPSVEGLGRKPETLVLCQSSLSFLPLLIKSLYSTPGSQIDLDAHGLVEGYGVFTFPYGPVTFGVPEAGGFKFVTYGERIVKVAPTINFKRRGIEQSIVGMKPDEALLLVERSAGNFSASYSTCFATAVEDSLRIETPEAAKWIRAVAIELERIYNHLHAFAREAEAATQSVAANQVHALKERVLRLNAKYFGHRFLFGFNEIGGVRCDLSSREDREELFSSVREIAKEFSEIVDYFLSSRIFLDRLQNTARLSKEDALSLGAVGPVARGSGIDWDDRQSYPIEPYSDIFVPLETSNDGDAMGRMMVRIREVASSTVAIEELLDRLPAGKTKKGAGEKNAEFQSTLSFSTTTTTSSLTQSDFSLCRIESPSGDLIQIVKLDKRGRIKSLHIRPPSFANWLSFAKSLEGNVFTDFQFSFESFGLSYADSDR